ncbi:MAG TPA: 1-deoxy-D-xylulose-5-phosphate reductoisomerase, partial [Ginsengibacter sp.]|nr:1-deoxy-D-xylulose-5-phosphate reductoisomerase [Ginsengibacter sp.]
MAEENKRKIAIFGSTGSIGTQALKVIKALPDLFEVEILTAQNNESLLIEQALQFRPNVVVIGDERKYVAVKEALSSTDIKVFAGEKSIEQAAEFDTYDVMLSAIVGFAGLKPTLIALEQGKAIALANKESLVVAGDLVMKLAVEK